MGFLSDKQSAAAGSSLVAKSDGVSRDKKKSGVNSLLGSNSYTNRLGSKNQDRLAGGIVTAESKIPTKYKEKAATSAVKRADNKAEKRANEEADRRAPGARQELSNIKNAGKTPSEVRGGPDGTGSNNDSSSDSNSTLNSHSNYDNTSYGMEYAQPTAERVRKQGLGQHGFAYGRLHKNVDLVKVDKAAEDREKKSQMELRRHIKAEAITDFAATCDFQLGFKKGDALTVLWRTHTTNDWWEAQTATKRGLVPANRIRLIRNT